MAVIEKRSSKKHGTRYRVRIRLSGHESVARTFDKFDDAKEWARQTEADIITGRVFPDRVARKRTVGDLIDRYVKETLPGKKLKSAHRQIEYLNWWRGQLGRLSMSDLRAARVTAALSHLMTTTVKRAAGKGKARDTGKTVAGATCNRYRAAFSAVCKVALTEYQWLQSNPCAKVKRKAEPKGRVRFLSPDERARLLAECKRHGGSLYDAVILSLLTAARQRELLGLRWCDVDLERAVVTFPDTKADEPRSVPLVGEALKIMQERFEARPAGHDIGLIFRGRKNPDKPLDVQAIFRRTCDRAGIKDFHWHDLRHTAASELAMSGASIVEIQAVTGHKTLAMVTRYAHVAEHHSRDVLERMAERVAAQGAKRDMEGA